MEANFYKSNGGGTIFSFSGGVAKLYDNEVLKLKEQLDNYIVENHIVDDDEKLSVLAGDIVHDISLEYNFGDKIPKYNEKVAAVKKALKNFRRELIHEAGEIILNHSKQITSTMSKEMILENAVKEMDRHFGLDKEYF